MSFDTSLATDEEIAGHCREIERCNQQGKCTLSSAGFFVAGTGNLDLAAYLATAMSRGALFLVGSVPGGADARRGFLGFARRNQAFRDTTNS